MLISTLIIIVHNEEYSCWHDDDDGGAWSMGNERKTQRKGITEMILIGIITNFSFFIFFLSRSFSFLLCLAMHSNVKRKSERDDTRKFNTRKKNTARRCYTTMENIINTHRYTRIFLNHIKGGTEKRWWDKKPMEKY